VGVGGFLFVFVFNKAASIMGLLKALLGNCGLTHVFSKIDSTFLSGV
jgi:hypothetical protein